MNKVLLDGETLTIEKVVAVARNKAEVEVAPIAKEGIEKCRHVVEDFVKEKRIMYGVTTGFGALSYKWIPPEEARELQENLIKSHCTGVGKPLREDIVRAMMLLRANTLAKGYSGIRLKTLEALVKMINAEVHPIVPEKGSVGASGDLAPLSHMVLVMIGSKDGKAKYKGQVMTAEEAMKKVGIEPVRLQHKEGLALNNGSQLMTAMGVLATYDADNLVKNSEIAAAMSLEALSGIHDAFDERIQNVRPFKGQITSARNIRVLINGSEIVKNAEEVIKLIQEKEIEERPLHDAYSLRCTPQVVGTVRDTIAYVKQVIETEMNSATDNPLIFADDKECFSGGNFHGQPIAAAMDFLAIALTTLGNISERRIARLIDKNSSYKPYQLPSFLIHPEVKEGLHSGFMLAQYTAASLASENKVLSHPASVDSIPTSANFEDFVSMGTTAARKVTEILRNVKYIIAIEMLCAAQGIELVRGIEKLGYGTKVAFGLIRRKVPVLRKDRVLFKDTKKIANLIESRELLNIVEKSVGSLK